MDFEPRPAYAGAAPSRRADARKLAGAKIAARRRRTWPHPSGRPRLQRGRLPRHVRDDLRAAGLRSRSGPIRSCRRHREHRLDGCERHERDESANDRRCRRGLDRSLLDALDRHDPPVMIAAVEASETFRCFGSTCAAHVSGEGRCCSPTEALARIKARLLCWHRRFTRFESGSELSALNADPRATVPARSPAHSTAASCTRSRSLKAELQRAESAVRRAPLSGCPMAAHSC